MGRDFRRIAAPENCLSPNTFKKQVEEQIIDDQGLRKDGRSATDLKAFSLQVGIVPSVTGSAYLECGRTKIVCSVNGPRDVLTKSESSVKGQLCCEFKYAMFSCKERQPYQPTDEENRISKSIQDALEPVILLHKFPKSRLDITIVVLENDGGVIPSAITCAGAALSNAGVEMYDLPVGCSLIHTGSKFLIDPTAEEELFCKNQENGVNISVAMMVEYKSQVTFMNTSGCVNHSSFSESLKMLQTACIQILTDLRLCLMKQVEDMSTDIEEKAEEGSISKKDEAQLKLFQPLKYMATFLENGVRPSARSLTEFRPILINVGAIETANGSALVRLGETSVLCGIKAELTNPSTSDPDKGFFVPNVSLGPLCSNRYVSGPPMEKAQVYSQMIMDLWESCPFIDPSDLCISSGQLSWCLFAEMTCLSCDGNVLDACILALMAALRHTKLPEVSINVDTNAIEVTDKMQDLKTSFLVFSATYSVLDEKPVADPSAEEESLAKASATIFLKDRKEVNVHSFGPIKQEQLFDCIEASKKRFSEVKQLIETLN